MVVCCVCTSTVIQPHLKFQLHRSTTHWIPRNTSRFLYVRSKFTTFSSERRLMWKLKATSKLDPTGKNYVSIRWILVEPWSFRNNNIELSEQMPLDCCRLSHNFRNRLINNSTSRQYGHPEIIRKLSTSCDLLQHFFQQSPIRGFLLLQESLEQEDDGRCTSIAKAHRAIKRSRHDDDVFGWITINRTMRFCAHNATKKLWSLGQTVCTFQHFSKGSPNKL